MYGCTFHIKKYRKENDYKCMYTQENIIFYGTDCNLFIFRMVIKSLLVGGWLMAAMAAAEPSSRAEPMVALLCPRPGEPANNLYHNKFLRDINHDNQCLEDHAALIFTTRKFLLQG